MCCVFDHTALRVLVNHGAVTLASVSIMLLYVLSWPHVTRDTLREASCRERGQSTCTELGVSAPLTHCLSVNKVSSYRRILQAQFTNSVNL